VIYLLQGLATYLILALVCLLGVVEFLAMTTITAPFANGGAAAGTGTGGAAGGDSLADAGSGSNHFFTGHAPREAYKGAAPMLGNVTALCLFLTVLCVMYTVVPRRNIEIDAARGSLRRGHGIDEHNAAAASAAASTSSKPGSQWPHKDDASGARNMANDDDRANARTDDAASGAGVGRRALDDKDLSAV
jgi:hypothetical protein